MRSLDWKALQEVQAVWLSCKKRWAFEVGNPAKILRVSWIVSPIRNYRDLIAWQKAMDLAVLLYQLTESFPSRERFGLAFELRRSGVSIPSNISEGHSQGTRAYVRHLVIAIGSHSEVCTQAELAFRLTYITGSDRAALENQLGEVGRLIQGLLNSLRR